jgi:hypothetical protein
VYLSASVHLYALVVTGLVTPPAQPRTHGQIRPTDRCEQQRRAVDTELLGLRPRTPPIADQSYTSGLQARADRT